MPGEESLRNNRAKFSEYVHWSSLKLFYFTSPISDIGTIKPHTIKPQTIKTADVMLTNYYIITNA